MPTPDAPGRPAHADRGRGHSSLLTRKAPAMPRPTRLERPSTPASRALGLLLALALTTAGLAGLAHQARIGWATDRLPNDGLTLLAYSATLAGLILAAHWAWTASRRARSAPRSLHARGSALPWPGSPEAVERPSQRQERP